MGEVWGNRGGTVEGKCVGLQGESRHGGIGRTQHTQGECRWTERGLEVEVSRFPSVQNVRKHKDCQGIARRIAMEELQQRWGILLDH